MTCKTLRQMKDKVIDDLDLDAEDFVGEDELTNLINAGIDEAEATILGIYEDYFLADEKLALEEGEDEYSLPSTIYASKLRRIVFNDGSRVYTVKRLTNQRKFEQLALAQNSNATSDDFSYLLKNPDSDGVVLQLSRPADTTYTAEDSPLTLWFIRNAATLSADDDTCDIPEFTEFVIQYAKTHIAKKESHPNLAVEIAALEGQRKLMVDTLSTMVPDEENQLEMDLSFYEEMN